MAKKRVNLQSIGFNSYAEYLKSGHWKQFRRRYMASDRLRKCLVCEKTPFQLHHITYARLGSEHLSDVIPLCDFHHREVHAVHKETGWPLGRWTDVVQKITGKSVREILGLPKRKAGKKKKRGPKPPPPPPLRDDPEVRKAQDALTQYRVDRIRADALRRGEKFPAPAPSRPAWIKPPLKPSKARKQKAKARVQARLARKQM